MISFTRQYHKNLDRANKCIKSTFWKRKLYIYNRLIFRELNSNFIMRYSSAIYYIAKHLLFFYKYVYSLSIAKLCLIRRRFIIPYRTLVSVVLHMLPVSLLSFLIGKTDRLVGIERESVENE